MGVDLVISGGTSTALGQICHLQSSLQTLAFGNEPNRPLIAPGSINTNIELCQVVGSMLFAK